MARKRFGLHTDPHIAEIGDDLEFAFRPEVMSDEFLAAYEQMMERQEEIEAASRSGGSQAKLLREEHTAVRDFLSDLMEPESAARFADTRLPSRVVTDLVSWVQEVYGDRPPTSSTDSAGASQRGGKSGTGASRSKGSTPARGRSRAS